MPGPFDWTQQPEAAGPITEPRSALDLSPTLDIQAFAQGTVRLPRLAVMTPEQHRRGEYVPLSAPLPFIQNSAEFRERERELAARKAEDSTAALRELIETSARRQGVAAHLARATADAVLRAAGEPAPVAAPETAAAPAAAADTARAADQPDPEPGPPAAVRPRSKETTS
jgi:hypothetical protein